MVSSSTRRQTSRWHHAVSTIRVREAYLADTNVLVGLHQSAFDVAWGEAAISGLLSNGARAWVATQSSDDIGFVLVRIAADEAELLSIGVMPGARRSGAGRKLVETAMNEARIGGASTLFLEVGQSNQAACALYAIAGFVRIGHRPNYYKNGEDAFVFSANLV